MPRDSRSIQCRSTRSSRKAEGDRASVPPESDMWTRRHVILYVVYTCGILITMKAIQITLDDELLARLDADEEVRRDGRSAVLRRAADEYLRKRRRLAIADQYARAYGSNPALGAEFNGWEDEGAWPER
jgi:hypothetical protein